MIADLCKKWDVICVSDEVYEWIVFDDSVHTRICTLPDMWERTITIGSAGKTFAVTGWSLGWAYGPADLLQYMHLFQSFTCATPLQVRIPFIRMDFSKIIYSPRLHCTMHTANKQNTNYLLII